MNAVEQNLANWKASLFPSISVASLWSRNPTAYKWKAPFRSLVLREATFWRITDLLTQSYALHQQGHDLGARILLRSGFETLATLVYLNQLMHQVLNDDLSFHTFGRKTSILLLGARNNSTGHVSLNIMTVLDKCDRQYPGLKELYADLSESAHPNYEGLCMGYSKIDRIEQEITFSNRWKKLYGEQHLNAMELCMQIFHREYDEVWPELSGKLENWIEANSETLDTTMDDL